MSTRSAPMVHKKEPADVAYRRAWLSLLLYPVSFVAAFVVGEGLLALVAEDSGDPAFWDVVVAGIPAVLVFTVPGVLAALFGRHAMQLGRPQGRDPALVGIAIAIAFIGLNALSYLAQVLLG